LVEGLNYSNIEMIIEALHETTTDPIVSKNHSTSHLHF